LLHRLLGYDSALHGSHLLLVDLVGVVTHSSAGPAELRRLDRCAGHRAEVVRDGDLETAHASDSCTGAGRRDRTAARATNPRPTATHAARVHHCCADAASGK